MYVFVDKNKKDISIFWDEKNALSVAMPDSFFTNLAFPFNIVAVHVAYCALDIPWKDVYRLAFDSKY